MTRPAGAPSPARLAEILARRWADPDALRVARDDPVRATAVARLRPYDKTDEEHDDESEDTGRGQERTRSPALGTGTRRLTGRSRGDAAWNEQPAEPQPREQPADMGRVVDRETQKKPSARLRGPAASSWTSSARVRGVDGRVVAPARPR